MKIAIITNKFIRNTKSVLFKLENQFKENALSYDVLDINSLQGGYDFVCVIGGDGTILKTAEFYADFNTPILGINLGRLGFLSQANENDIQKLVKCIKERTYNIQERIMLKSADFVALNDFVLKGSCTRTSKFALKINDKFVCDYIADGIIISTPTGSTAYGLSAGGPILAPNLDCIVIVPICPHTLNARSLVIPTSEKITIGSMDEKLVVAVDGHEMKEKISEFNIELSPKKTMLAFIGDDDFYSLLRNKLHWGISPTDKD